MKITPKYGVAELLFGMKQKDVETLYGKPDKNFRDDDQNIIYVYNDQKWRLTFYEDEEFRLGYIIAAHPELELFGQKIIGAEMEVIKTAASEQGFKSWEKEEFDLAENYFNEDNWTILVSEFGAIVKVEIGAIINDKDELDWKFKSK